MGDIPQILFGTGMFVILPFAVVVALGSYLFVQRRWDEVGGSLVLSSWY